jgi:MFS family permease
MTDSTRERVVLRSADDVISLVDSGRFRPRRAKTVMVVALGSIFVDGWDLGSFGLGTVQIRRDFGLGTGNVGFDSLPFISASVLVGALVGGLLGGFLTDRVGRARMFLVDLVLLVVATVLAAVAPNPELFTLFRFLMGVGVGLDVPVALAFVAEFSAISSKGRNVNVAQVCSTAASAVAFLAVIPLYALGVGDSLWRWAIGLGAVPALIVLGLRFASNYESPMWAARHQGVDEAVAILRRSYVVDVDLVVAPEARAAQRARHVRPGDLAQLFRGRFARRTLLVSVLVVAQAVEFYAISLYTPSIFAGLFGASAIYRILLVSALANVVGALGAYTCVRVTQRLGLRRMAVIGYLGTGTCLLVVSALFDALPAGVAALVIVAFYFAHNFGPGYAGTAMGTLSYPTSIRGIAGGYTQAITRVGGILGAYLFPVLTTAYSARVTIGVIVLAPVVALVAVAAIRWDPVNRDVERDTATPAAVPVATA